MCARFAAVMMQRSVRRQTQGRPLLFRATTSTCASFNYPMGHFLLFRRKQRGFEAWRTDVLWSPGAWDACRARFLMVRPGGRQEIIFSSAVLVRIGTPDLGIRIVLQIGHPNILRHDHGYVQGRLSKRSFRLGGIGTHASWASLK